MTDATKRIVQMYIGVEKLKNSTNEHFNDIPLKTWDALPIVYNRPAMESCGDYLTIAGHVCIMKEAALQLIEE